MSRRLIINADGFGFTYGNNRAIFDVLNAGFVKSISVNANFPAVEDVTRVVKEFPKVTIGVHLNLSVGKPICKPEEIPSLLNSEGNFWDSEFPKKALSGKLSMIDIQKELEAQFIKLRSFGVIISHWDSHQDRHLFLPFFISAIKVATKHGVMKMRNHRRRLFAEEYDSLFKTWRFNLTHPRRLITWTLARALMRYAVHRDMRMADHFLCTGAHNEGKDNHEIWVKLLHSLPSGTSEITCHPGYPDETLREYATMVENRPKEAAVLKNTVLLDIANKCNVEIINYDQL